MAADCPECRCSVAPRLSVAELVERGFRRNRASPRAIEGAACADPDGNRARFSLDAIDDRIVEVSFRASSCATLIAFCEYLAEIVPGLRLVDAKALAPADLVAAVGGIPLLKQPRAAVAVAAWRAAVAKAEEGKAPHG